MSENFIEIKAYRCKHCKQLFITQRHNCKRNPSLKNCFTCENHTTFKEFQYDAECYEYGTTKRIFSTCKYADTEKYDMNLLDLCKNGWHGWCSEYKKSKEA